MNKLLSSVYSKYENVYFVHRDLIGLTQVADVMKINEDSIRSISSNNHTRTLLTCPLKSLIVIDVNSVGIDNTDYYLFLLACFNPTIGVVLIANNLSQANKNRYLASRVLAIIKGTDPTIVSAEAA